MILLVFLFYFAVLSVVVILFLTVEDIGNSCLNYLWFILKMILILGISSLFIFTITPFHLQSNYCKQEGGYLSDVDCHNFYNFECTFGNVTKLYKDKKVHEHVFSNCVKFNKWKSCVKYDYVKQYTLD